MKKNWILPLFTFTLFAICASAFAQQEQWGGDGISIVVQDNSAQLEFECASGAANGTWIPMFRQGRPGAISAVVVNAKGSFKQSSGISVGTPVDVTYLAVIKGNQMTLQIENQGVLSQEFRAWKNQPGSVPACMRP